MCPQCDPRVNMTLKEGRLKIKQKIIMVQCYGMFSWNLLLRRGNSKGLGNRARCGFLGDRREGIQGDYPEGVLQLNRNQHSLASQRRAARRSLGVSVFLPILLGRNSFLHRTISWGKHLIHQGQTWENPVQPPTFPQPWALGDILPSHYSHYYSKMPSIVRHHNFM